MPRLKTLICLLFLLSTGHGMALGSDKNLVQDFQALERETRAIKAQMLELEAAVNAAQEQIRYPAPTRWTVFVTADGLDDYELQVAELYVDGRTLSSHRYSEDERKALGNGGAHQLHLGNLAAGEHRVVAVAVVAREGETFELENSFLLDKPAGPRLMELRLINPPDAAFPAIKAHRYADEPS